MSIVELKAQAYDVLAEIQSLQVKLEQLFAKLQEVNSQIEKELNTPDIQDPEIHEVDLEEL